MEMKKEDLDLMRFLREGASTKRYHTQRRIRSETVGQHSHGVLWLCWYFADRRPTANLLLAASAHDLAEQPMGDIPSPAKRAMGQIFSQEFDAKEETYLATHGLVFELSDEEKIILKTADLMDGLFSCLEERVMGNNFACIAFGNYANYIKEFIHGDKFPPKVHRLACDLSNMIFDSFDAVNNPQSAPVNIIKGSLRQVFESLGVPMPEDDDQPTEGAPRLDS